MVMESTKPRKSQVFQTQYLSINRLNTKRRLLYLKAQSVPRSKHFSFRL